MIRDPQSLSGGEPSRSWPFYEEDEIAAAVEVLRSGRPNQWGGSRVAEFEQTFAAAAGCAHAVALANGSVALDASLSALGVGPGDEVVVTPRSFVASASAVALAGATPVFADVCPESQAITADSVAKVMTGKTRAVVAVHVGGYPCDMEAILALARDRGIKVVEDAAQAHGARWNGKPAGSFGDVAAWSFCQDKLISTAGEGGMVTTNDPELYERIWSIKDHGRNRAKAMGRSDRPGFRWLIESFGSNWRMTELQAAVGCAQLAKLPAWLAARRRNAAIFAEIFATCPQIRLPRLPGPAEPCYYRFYAFVRPENLGPGWDRDRILAEAEARGVDCRQGVCGEIYLEQAFVKAFGKRKPLPNARTLNKTGLCFQTHHNLTAANVTATALAMRDIFESAGRRVS